LKWAFDNTLAASNFNMFRNNTLFSLTAAAMALVISVGCNTPEKGKPVAESKKANGKLFIIGGGDRTESLMTTMIEESGIKDGDYIAILPMSSEEPDSAFFYISQDIALVTSIPCVNLNFEEKDIINRAKLDSVEHAKIIFITGGDQKNFMNIVNGTPLQTAIEKAYQNGALIGGTSAGAAVMSEVMITGEENFSPEYEATYDKVWKANGIYATGMGLVKNVIIDQHFVVRSRYNRLLSAICDHPGHMGIGIDEETALLVKGDSAFVTGDSQIIVIYPSDSCALRFREYGAKNIRMDLLMEGDFILLNRQ
jgi:cyanophycinase